MVNQFGQYFYFQIIKNAQVNKKVTEVNEQLQGNKRKRTAFGDITNVSASIFFK